MNTDKLKIMNCITLSMILSGNLSLYPAARIQSEDSSTLSSKSEALGLKLIQAALDCNEEVAEALIKQGANVNTVNENRNTALMVAAVNIKEEIVRLLINSGANVNAISNSGRTALTNAAMRGHKGIIQLLISAKADVRGIPGQEALRQAVWHDKSIVKLLLNEANIDAADKSGFTPLMWAVVKGNKEVVQLLIDAGANLEAVDTIGRKAITLAHEQLDNEQYGNEKTKKDIQEIIKVLLAEPARREAATQRRKEMAEHLKQLKEMPTVIIPIIDSYLASNLPGILSDYIEAEIANHSKENKIIAKLLVKDVIDTSLGDNSLKRKDNDDYDSKENGSSLKKYKK